MANLALSGYVMSMLDKNLVIDTKDLIKHFNTIELGYFTDRIKNYILDNITRRSDKATIIVGKKEYVMKLSQMLVQLYFLEPHVKYRISVTDDCIINFDENFVLKINKHIEHVGTKFEKLLTDLDKIDELSYIFARITTNLVKLAEDFSPISAPSFDLFDIIDFSNRNNEFKKLLNTELDTSKSFIELENYLDTAGKRLRQIVLGDKNNCLYSFNAVNRLNVTQSTQMFIGVGPRASTQNIIMPHVIKQSYLQGFNCAADVLSEAEVALKALINKKKHVGESGYLSHETDLLTGQTDIDYKVQDCGTKHYLKFEVKTKDHLLMIVNKHMIINDKGDLRPITAKDTHLIGTTVKLRSFITCAIKERGKICMNCYGTTSKLKKSTVIGGLASIKTLNPVSNMLMATKHKSSTRTIEFSDPTVLKYFEKCENGLIIRDDFTEPNKTVSIAFNKDYIEDIMERGMESDSDDGSMSMKMINMLTFVYRSKDPETLEDIEETEQVCIDSVFLVLSDDMLENIDKTFEMNADDDSAYLHLDNLKQGTCVFDIIHITEETSKYLNQIKRIVKRPKTEAYDNQNDPTQQLSDLLIEAGLGGGKAELTHIEAIIYNLVRDAGNVLERPDFKSSSPNVTVLNLDNAILKGDLYTGLVFQEISSQLLDTDCYYKHGEGIHDSQFKVKNNFNFKNLEKQLKKTKYTKRY